MVQFHSPQVRKFLPTLLLLSVIILAGCASSAPLSEEQQAGQYGMTVERYREEKQAAARMNMKWEDHVQMLRMDGELK